MSQEYFYFVSGLPNIGFEDSKLAYSPEQFRIEAKAQLSSTDYRYLEFLHLGEDIKNLLSLIYKSKPELNQESLFHLDYWESYIAFIRDQGENRSLAIPALFASLPSFISPVIGNVLSQEDIQPYAKTEHELITAFYQWAAIHSCEFINKWFALDAHIRNILAAINGRKFDLPYAQYLIGENDTVDKLGKSHAADFGLGKDDLLFDSLIRIYEQNNILFRERGYDILRWKWIDNQNFFNYFNIDRVLGYYCKLRILHRWVKADPNYGKEVFHDILNALENSFSFPEEFNIKSIRK